MTFSFSFFFESIREQYIVTCTELQTSSSCLLLAMSRPTLICEHSCSSLHTALLILVCILFDSLVYVEFLHFVPFLPYTHTDLCPPWRARVLPLLYTWPALPFSSLPSLAKRKLAEE